MAIVWQGSTELTQGKATLTMEATKWTLKVSFFGPYPLCQTAAPAIGQPLTGFPAALLTHMVNVIELDGDAGQIEIEAICLVDPSTFGADPIGAAIYEDEWIELQKPIEAHPLCGILDPARSYYLNGVASADGTTGGKRRTWEDWAILLGTANLGSYTQIDYNDAEGDPPWGTIWSLADYQSIKEAGVDSYLLFQPVLKRTTYHFYPPEDLGDLCGQVTTPPSAVNFAGISDYEWLQGPDRCTRTKGIFCRTTEWQGFEPSTVSSLIYQGA